MTQSGLVSVIIPTFNRGNLIARAIQSVLNQTYGLLEVIIIDDGSTDNTESVVKTIKDARIRYYWFKNSGSPARSRNKGIELACGEFLSFLDSDDSWLPDKLQKQVQYMLRNPDCFLVYAKCLLQSEGRAIIESPKVMLGGCIFKELYLSYNFISCLTVLMKNSRDYRPYYFCEDRKLFAAEDYDLWLNIAKNEKIGYLDETLAIYNLHDSNISSGAYATFIKWHYIAYKFRDNVPKSVFLKKMLLLYVKFLELSGIMLLQKTSRLFKSLK
jgi:glycosyltransferase involved in cell wall biosynthesis